MLTIKVIAISKSGKSALVAITKPFGKFTSVLAQGNLAISEPVVVGETFELPDSVQVSTTTSVSPEDPNVSFTWITLA